MTIDIKDLGFKVTELSGAAEVQRKATNRLLRLRDTMMAAERKNPITSPVMASPPTVTVSATADATLTQIYTFAAGGSIIAPSSTSAADKVNWLGGEPKVYGNTQVTQVVSTFYPNLDGNMVFPAAQAGTDPSLTADMNMVLGGFEFETSAPTVELRLYLDTALSVCFQVDGEFVTKTGYTATTGTTVRGDYYKLAFGSSASRRIRVMLTASPQTRALADPNGALQGFSASRSIAVPAGYIIWKPKRRALRLGVFGDSYSTGVGGNNATGTWKVPGTSYPAVLGDLLGFSDVRVFGIGSTGYAAEGSGRRNMVNAFPLFKAIAGGSLGLDLAVVGHGYNDRTLFGTDPTSVSANITSALALLRATDPYLPIIVLGAQAGSTGPSATIIGVEAAIKAVVEARQSAGDKFIQFVPVSPDAVNAWTYGTGNAAAPNGTGPADIDVASDETHPTTPYANKIGYRGAFGVRDAIDTMLLAA